MNVPDHLRYTRDHEWVRFDNGVARVGITDYAQDALGDVVFVQLPAPGTAVRAGERIGEIESTKSVSDVYSPLSGTITQVNAELADHPERLNEDPYGDGWICDVEVADGAELDGLLDAEAYRGLTEG